MKGSSRPSIRISPMHQMGTAVKSVDTVVANYWKYFGVGPWIILRMSPPDIFDRMYHRNPSEYKGKAALGDVGKFQIEVMEHIKGNTTYKDYIDKHGEGPHHLQYLVDDLDTLNRHVAIMRDLGFESEMSGRTGTDGGFNYVNAVSRLKAIWEPVREPEGVHEVSGRYPADKEAVSPAKLKITSVSQVVLVVNKLEEVMESYTSIFGIGPWKVVELAPPVLHSVVYHGKPANFTARMAIADTGLAQLALVQPLSGENIYSDWLNTRGEGIHHVQFTVEDIGRTTDIMNEMGFTTLMSGGISDGAFALYDTIDAVKCIWEAYQPPKKMPEMKPYPQATS